MASHKNYRFLDLDLPAGYPVARHNHHPALELNESDIYESSAPSLEPRSQRKLTVKRIEDHHPQGHIPRKVTSSLPVNIPDWSKILGEEYRVRDDYLDDDNDDDERYGVECRDRLPPHEFLARTRVASSFSVHEGAGRTLKGRDLSRVRNAIWAKIGFQD